MDIEFYNLLNLKFKKKRDIPEIWDKIVNNIDDFISDFLKSFDIDIDFLYTTNVGLLNVNSNSRSSILWDLSYWSIYVNYLEFVFWMEKEQDSSSEEAIYPFYMKEKITIGKSKVDAHRLVFLSTIFQYVSYKFYSEAKISYCFALLYDANKCSRLHNVSNEEAEEYKEYIEEQLAVTKLFCAFHEAYHLKKIDAPGDVNYRERILYNVKTMVNSKEFEVYYAYDRRLIDDVRKRVNLMNEQDNLFDELYSDAAALDLLDVVLNYMNVFQPQWSMEKFSLVVKEMIENFYAFNTLTYDLYMIWNANINLLNGQITEDVYEQEVHERDVEDVIRGQIFPAILWIQIDNILSEKGKLPPIPKKRCVNVKKEMVNFFNIAYNDELKNAVCSAVKQGFCKSKLTIEEARDILIEWDELGKFSNAKVDDLFLKGGIDDETDFFMFVRGY